MVTGSESGDIIWGGAGIDYLEGAGGADIIHGGDGEDFIFGGEGPWNLLYGENGRDVIVGGDGDDTIAGGDDSDLLTGGAGGDTFVFHSELVATPIGTILSSDSFEFAADTITDFDSSSDAIAGVLKGGSYAEMSVSHEGMTQGQCDGMARFDAAELEGNGFGQVFLYNEGLDRGYLFWDADADGDFDSSLILAGCGHAEDFSAFNLI